MKSIQQAAQRALKTVGTPAVLVHMLPGAYDPSTRTQARIEARYPVSVTLDETSLAGLGDLFGGDLVRKEDMKATMTGNLPADPTSGDRLEIDGVAFEVIAARPTVVKGVRIITELLVRRGHK